MRIRRIHCVLPFAALAAAPLLGCGQSDPSSTETSAGGSGGGSGAGGSAKAEPDYASAFPQDRVPRIDITITPDRWQAMIDDMADLFGAFGERARPGGGGFGPPAEWIEACNGLAAGDACTVSMMGVEEQRTCVDGPGILLCLPVGKFGDSEGGELSSRTPIYAECDIATEDRAWHHVGIRFKGNSSLSMSWQQGVWKLPLRFNFDKYEDTYPETKNQRFYGFDSLSFANGWADPSLLREKLGTEVFVNAGIAAPATAFYRVFIDHGDGPTYFGLYTGIELPSDDAFLDTHFGGHKGNLYQPDGTAARWGTWDRGTLGKENHKDEADFSDAQALFDALHADRADAAAWRAGLEAHLDVDGFLHWLALNTVIEDWDQYGRMSHNYFLYADPSKGGQFRWIPWDHTFAFPSSEEPVGLFSALSLSLSEATEQWPLIRYLLDDPVYLEVYRGHVTQAAQTDYEPAAAEGRFRAAHDLIAPYVVGPEGEIAGHTFLSSPTAFDDGLDVVIAHAKGRQADIAAYLGP